MHPGPKKTEEKRRRGILDEAESLDERRAEKKTKKRVPLSDDLDLDRIP